MGENYHFLLHLFAAFNFFITLKTALVGAASDRQPPQELLRGFTASPNQDVVSFQAFLSDSTGNYSLGFLRVNGSGLALAVVHLASAETIWRANMTSLARWASPTTQIIFNGSLIVSDSTKMGRVLWSTYTNGDRVFLSNSSNLQIQTLGNFNSPLWQSFDFPSDTLVENQNFTNKMWLTSSNGLYSMQLGSNFMALYGEFQPGSYPGQIYWKHKALEANVENPIYMVLKSNGFLGMYQNGSAQQVDVQSFNSFQQPVSGVRRVRLESDGNLKGYFWTGSSWILDYQSISDQCELPSACGPYGLCKPGIGCSCLNNKTEYNNPGRCLSPVNQDSGQDLCSENTETTTTVKILETIGVDLPFKELMSYVTLMSFNQCQIACLESCTCWGAVYSNSSGFCYMLQYPIQTLISVGDDSRLGYFKVREDAGKNTGKVNVGLGVGAAILCLIVFVIGVGFGIWWYKFRNGKRKKTGARRPIKVDGGIGPYEDLEDHTIELSQR